MINVHCLYHKHTFRHKQSAWPLRNLHLCWSSLAVQVVNWQTYLMAFACMLDLAASLKCSKRCRRHSYILLLLAMQKAPQIQTAALYLLRHGLAL